MNVRTRLALVTLALSLPVCAVSQLAPLPATNTSVTPVTPKVKAEDNKSSTGEIPLDSAATADPADVAATSSPMEVQRRGLYLLPGTAISLRLAGPASSGTLHNGQLVDGKLLRPVRIAAGTVYPTGTPVRVTVLSSAPAGKIQSAGVLTIQAVRVGPVAVITNVLEFDGKEGHKDVADAAPAKGSEAMIQSSATLNFKVLGPGNTPAPDKTDDQGNPVHGGNPKAIPSQSTADQTSSQAGQGTTTQAPAATTPH